MIKLVNIKRQIIRNTNYKNGTRNPKKFITLHMTGNRSRGANAQAHANLQSNGNSRGASWHWQVDDKQAIQSFNHNMQLWHASDGQGSGNNESIGIEGCVNADGNFNKMMKNYVDLVVYIMKQEGIKTTNSVVTHKWWSGKNCPTEMFNGKNGWTYNYFIAQVNKDLKSKTAKQKDIGDGFILNPYGVQYKRIDGTWKNGSEPITTRFGAPDTRAKNGGTIKPGRVINYTGICRFGGYIWLEYTENKGKTWKYAPVKTWNQKTGAVGPEWGTWIK